MLTARAEMEMAPTNGKEPEKNPVWTERVPAAGSSRKVVGHSNWRGVGKNPELDDDRGLAGAGLAPWNGLRAQRGHGRPVMLGIGSRRGLGGGWIRGSADAKSKHLEIVPDRLRAAGKGSFCERR